MPSVASTSASAAEPLPMADCSVSSHFHVGRQGEEVLPLQ